MLLEVCRGRMISLTFAASVALHLAPVPRFRAVLAEVTNLIAVTAGGIRRVLGLFALFRHVSFLTVYGER